MIYGILKIYIFIRNGLVLHELDVEDDSKLLSCMMNLVRCGLLDEAQVQNANGFTDNDKDKT